jgi:hypothetical protein
LDRGKGSVFGKRLVQSLKKGKKSSYYVKKAKDMKKMKREEAMRLIIDGARGVYILGQKEAEGSCLEGLKETESVYG